MGEPERDGLGSAADGWNRQPPEDARPGIQGAVRRMQRGAGAPAPAQPRPVASPFAPSEPDAGGSGLALDKIVSRLREHTPQSPGSGEGDKASTTADAAGEKPEPLAPSRGETGGPAPGNRNGQVAAAKDAGSGPREASPKAADHARLPEAAAPRSVPPRPPAPKAGLVARHLLEETGGPSDARVPAAATPLPGVAPATASRTTALRPAYRPARRGKRLLAAWSAAVRKPGLVALELAGALILIVGLSVIGKMTMKATAPPVAFTNTAAGTRSAIAPDRAADTGAASAPQPKGAASGRQDAAESGSGPAQNTSVRPIPANAARPPAVPAVPARTPLGQKQLVLAAKIDAPAASRTSPAIAAPPAGSAPQSTGMAAPNVPVIAAISTGSPGSAAPAATLGALEAPGDAAPWGPAGTSALPAAGPDPQGGAPAPPRGLSPPAPAGKPPLAAGDAPPGGSGPAHTASAGSPGRAWAGAALPVPGVLDPSGPVWATPRRNDGPQSQGGAPAARGQLSPPGPAGAPPMVARSTPPAQGGGSSAAPAGCGPACPTGLPGATSRPAASGAAAGASPGRVVIHFTATDGADHARRVAERLEAAAGVRTEIRSVDFEVSHDNARFFWPGDRDLARRSLAVLDNAGARLRDFTHYDPPPSRGTVEVWLKD